MVVESGAGVDAGFPDAEYVAAGALVEVDAAAIVARADIILHVGAPPAGEIAAMREGAIVLGSLMT